MAMRLICATTDDRDYANYALIEVDELRAKNLLAYRPLIEPLVKHDDTFYCVEFFEDAEWGEHVNTVTIPDASDGWLRAAEGVGVSGDCRTAAGTLRVTEDGVLWSASPKHSDGHFETQELSWSQLEDIAAGRDPFVTVEKEDDGEEAKDGPDQSEGNEER